MSVGIPFQNLTAAFPISIQFRVMLLSVLLCLSAAEIFQLVMNRFRPAVLPDDFKLWRLKCSAVTTRRAIS